jgi:hypothetical protein
MMQALSQPHLVQELRRGAPAGAIPAQLERHHHVFDRGQRRQELEVLENEADLFSAQFRPVVFAQAANLSPRQLHRAGARLVQTRAQAQQSGLTAAGRPHNRARAPRWECKGNILQDRQFSLGAGVRFRQPANLQNGRHRMSFSF